MQKKWWMTSIGYQIYPKSFFDTNDDGIGDLPGIIAKLDYLAALGVNLIWVCPFYDSPMDDNGYDVRDFFNVAAQFGTMDDVKTLISEAHQRNIKVVLDFVLNHTSDEHPWFIESRASKDNPYRDYYIWHDGKTIDGKKKEPTNWGSFFGGSAWKYDEPTDSYFMKIFSDKMPDLNWKNPSVRKEMIQIAHTWLDYGVDGFRIDAVSHLDRAPYEDVLNQEDTYPLDWHKFSNLPKVHDYLKELYDAVFGKRDVLTIGEVGGAASIEEGLKYAAFDRHELSMVFNFDHNWCNNLHDVNHPKKLKTDVIRLKKVFHDWQEAFKDRGWLPLNWLNHDQPRLMSQYGSFKYPLQSAKLLATILHMMRGTPFIYQGEEIGMTNFPWDDVSQFEDISSIAAYRYHLEKNPEDPVLALKKAGLRSRDNARTPMQWSSEPYAGFSTTQPWLPIHPNYRRVNVQNALKNKDSLWYHYQRLIQLRKESPYHEIITYGSLEFMEMDHPTLFTYKRTLKNQTLIVIGQFSNQPIRYQLKTDRIYQPVISNYPDVKIKQHTLKLRPYESIVFEVKETL